MGLALRARLELIQFQLPVVAIAILIVLIILKLVGGAYAWNLVYLIAGVSFSVAGICLGVVGLTVALLRNRPTRTWLEALALSCVLAGAYAALFRVLVEPTFV